MPHRRRQRPGRRSRRRGKTGKQGLAAGAYRPDGRRGAAGGSGLRNPSPTYHPRVKRCRSPLRRSVRSNPKNSFKECDALPRDGRDTGRRADRRLERRRSERRPPYTVVIAQPFAVGKFEVTFAERDACISDNGCSQKPNDQGWGRDRRPVVDVSADHIQTDLIPWLRKKTGRDYRLRTEAEWEYSARAGTLTAYPWGNEAGRKSSKLRVGAPTSGANSLHL